MTSQAETSRYRAELEDMYSRFGWNWVVLAYMAGRVLSQGKQLPSDFLQNLTLARTKMESGCYGVCDVGADLQGLENKLMPLVLQVGEGELHSMFELIGKAMDGSLRQKDVDLKPFKVVLVDCSIPKCCSSHE